jgi:hypothetical protein
LNNAGAAWNKRDKRKVKRFFLIRGILLRNGMLNAEEHCRQDVEEIQSNQERQKSSELERCCVAVVCESINANADANENTDNAWRRKKREQVLV